MSMSIIWRCAVCALALAALLATAAPGLGAVGDTDTAFTSALGSGPDKEIIDVAAAPDDKLVVIGDFTSWNGTSVPKIVRLNADGTRDTGFDAGTGPASGYLRSVAVQPSGKIIVTGSFLAWNGTTGLGGIVRLNTDGSVDTAFATTTGTGFTYSPSGLPVAASIVTQSDGKIVAVGQFDGFNGAFTLSILRLTVDGATDATFNLDSDDPGGFYAPSWIKTLSDGRLLVGGQYLDWGGAANTSMYTLLSADGMPDTTWRQAAGWVNNTTYTGEVQSDGKAIISGNFTGDNLAKYLARVDADGAPDAGWTAGSGEATNWGVMSMALLAGDTTVMVGSITKLAGVDAPGITAIKADGSADTDFLARVGTGVKPLSATDDSKVEVIGDALYVYGDFTEWNGSSASRIVRLAATTPAPEADANASEDTPVAAVTLKGKPKTTKAGIVTRITVTSPGQLTQVGLKVNGRSLRSSLRAALRVCKASRDIKKAGTYTITCRLTAAGRRALVRKSLRITLRTTFTPTGGKAETTSRAVTVPRLKVPRRPPRGQAEAVTG